MTSDSSAYFKECTNWTALEKIILLDDLNRVNAKKCLIRFEIHSIVTDATITDIKQKYQSKENNEESGGSSYQDNNSDGNSKSPDERMSKRQRRSETTKQVDNNDHNNFVEVCPSAEICKKCWSRINYFELGDDDLSDDEYEIRLIEANLVNISSNRSLTDKDLLKILKEQAKSNPFPNVNITGLKNWIKQNYLRDIDNTLSNLRATTEIKEFDKNQFDLIKRILEYKLAFKGWAWKST
ncbi:10200_t:CDS:2 [Funneliformis mosseae]|uniref:10200_t:CDS:1 n=1 Tax=Funneliformis mosseae TaxID=27381 RepID=A0A9N9H3H1_FUNMO|nr:10200_t:CDS:2 [Funneliformis mosseae]